MISMALLDWKEWEAEMLAVDIATLSMTLAICSAAQADSAIFLKIFLAADLALAEVQAEEAEAIMTARVCVMICILILKKRFMAAKKI